MTPGPTIQDLIQEVQQDAADPDPLVRLRTAAALTQEVTDVADAALGYFVDQARRAGHSWSEIGEALGVSKQAAQQRHVRVAGGLTATFGRFTDRARRVVAACEFAARDLGHGYIGTEHLLLALYSEPQGIAAQILAEGGLTAQAVRDSIVEATGEGSGAPEGTLPYTPRTVQAFTAALGSALELGHNYIGTEHLLLGLVGGDGIAALILHKAGFTPEGVLDAVKSKLAPLQAPAAGTEPATAAEKAPAKKQSAKRPAAKAAKKGPSPKRS